MPSTLTVIVAVFELGLAAAGLYLWRRLFLSRQARAAVVESRLPYWHPSIPDFLVFLVFVIGGSFFTASVASLVAKMLQLRGDSATIFLGAFTQLGMLGGVALYWASPERGRPTGPPGGPGILLSGAVTFLVSLPLLLFAARLWELLLEISGLPTERQSLIDMFSNAESPLQLTIMILLAVAIAPVTEELVFRAGLFRFLRSRTPRWMALGVSGLLFAALHVNWVTLEGLTSLVPLMLLAIMFALAYERTGKIGTPMVAHALFNLNTILLIFAGVGT